MRLVQPADQALQEFPGAAVLRVPLVKLVLQEAKDNPEGLVQLVRLDQLGQLVIQGLLDLQGRKAHLGQQEQVVH